jgi:hypothetical protein
LADDLENHQLESTEDCVSKWKSKSPEWQREYYLKFREQRLAYAKRKRLEAKAQRYTEVTWKTKLKASLQKRAAELAKRRTIAAQLSQVMEMRL